MKLGNFKIGTRLGFSFGVILLLLVIVAVLGVSRMTQIQQSLVAIADGNNTESTKAAKMAMTVADRSIAMRNIVLLEAAADMQKEVERIRVQTQAYDTAEAKLQSAFDTFGMIDEEKKLMASIKDDKAAAGPVIEKIIKLGLANQNPEAIKVLMTEFRPIINKWRTDLATLEDSETRQSEEAIVAADANYQFAKNMTIGLSAAALAFGLALAWAITRSITVPVNYAVSIAQTVAAGDLTSKIEVNASDETGILISALRDMNENLKKIVSQVRAGTDTMSVASQEIATGNLDLSSRTEEQASSLEETASSMEELTSTVKQNSDNARQANSLALSASEVASKGGAVVAQVVDTMGAINDASKKIVEIISVIDGIAFQTNILALNAAVEAARAGEQGRGFAVVATEVRNLAQRSAAAAKEIKTLIGNSVEKVDAGAKLVDEAGMTMSEVVESVRRVSDIISEITAAGHEQVHGIEQINQAIMQMDSVTQQNAALVEQSAAAAESLQDQATTLTKVVSMFILDQQDALVSKAPNVHQRAASAKSPGTALTLTTKRPAVKPSLKVPAVKPKSAATDGQWEEF